MKTEKKITLTSLFLGGVLIFVLSSWKSDLEELEPNDSDHSYKSKIGSPKDFIKRFKDLANFIQLNYLVPSSVTLSQSGLESAWGESYLAKNANNYFGIIADSSWKGATILREADGAKFRKYETAKDSFIDYAKFLVKNKNYEAAFNTTDSLQFAKAVANGNYGGLDSSQYYKILSGTILSVQKMLDN